MPGNWLFCFCSQCLGKLGEQASSLLLSYHPVLFSPIILTQDFIKLIFLPQTLSNGNGKPVTAKPILKYTNKTPWEALFPAVQEAAGQASVQMC